MFYIPYTNRARAADFDRTVCDAYEGLAHPDVITKLGSATIAGITDVVDRLILPDMRHGQFYMPETPEGQDSGIPLLLVAPGELPRLPRMVASLAITSAWHPVRARVRSPATGKEVNLRRLLHTPHPMSTESTSLTKEFLPKTLLPTAPVITITHQYPYKVGGSRYWARLANPMIIYPRLMARLLPPDNAGFILHEAAHMATSLAQLRDGTSMLAGVPEEIVLEELHACRVTKTVAKALGAVPGRSPALRAVEPVSALWRQYGSKDKTRPDYITPTLRLGMKPYLHHLLQGQS